jgi:predicted nucleic acid-binding protein
MQSTTHFTFRPLSMSDADVELNYKWLNMPHIQKAYSRPSSVITKSEALEYLKQHLEKPMSGFTVLADDVPVGYIGFYAVKECPWPEQDLPEKMVSQVEESRVQMLGPIRQELLSGIASHAQFKKLKTHLLAFPDLLITTEDYELAAEYFNICRAKEIQGSAIDFLICAVASHHKLAIFTTDNDFIAYASKIPVMLHKM